MVGAMTGRPMAVAISPLLAGQEAIEGIHEVIVRAGPDLHHDDARRRVWHEHRQQSIAVALPRRRSDERLALGGEVEQTAAAPGLDAYLARLYGKMLRMASRNRPSPPPTGADS